MARKTSISDSLRRRVMERDNFICRACGFGGSEIYMPFLDADHIVSESNSGATELNNLQCLCKACNGYKGKANWTFKIRTQPVSEMIWNHNHKVMRNAFIRDTAQRLKKLK